MIVSESIIKRSAFMLSSKEFIKLLEVKGYDFDLHEHEALFTVEDSNKLRGAIKGSHSKNLFLKNKKNNFFLISCEEFSEINLKKIAKSLNLGNVSFAKEEYLEKILGIKPGSVSPFALLNDTENKVDFFLEDKLHDSEFVNFHPITNTGTVTIKCFKFIEFMIENNKKIHIFSTSKEKIIKTYEQ
jgi:Ala-tRNA(Pro) deacylase